jgi:membrane associated rhomboid family serine protease
MGQRGKQTFFASPHAVTYILILLNSAVFGVCLLGNSLARIDSGTLFHYGALYHGALSRQEYWRLVAYAFLHANVLHFGLNMLCIGAWCGLLEHRLGATYFLIVYLASAIGGAIASIYGHPGVFLGVGASGAISGVLGALLCLTLLGRLTLSAQFFVVTIGANVLLAARVPNVDWAAHLGGFATGFASIAVLDALEGFNRRWLRCKFPEFVKLGIAIGAVFAAWFLYLETSLASGSETGVRIAEGILTLLIAVKLTDLLLARPKGLAILALAIAALYAALAAIGMSAMAGGFPAYCMKANDFAKAQTMAAATPFLDAACRHAGLWHLVLAPIVFVASLMLLRPELRRGLNDVGFIANTFQAERRRRQGL